MRWFLFLSCCSLAFGCTDFVVQAKDGTYVNGRSLEFDTDLQAKIKLFPRNQKMTSQSPDRKKGLSWVSKYGFLGLTAFGQNFSFDGLNEMGLSYGALWLPAITQYPTVPPADMKRALDFVDVGAWVLGNFASVQEVKAALRDVSIWGHPVPPLEGIPPLHVAIHDAKGNNLVVEFIQGEIRVYDNPNSVLTNSPSFDWQMTNLSNFLNLNALNAEPVSFNGVTLTPPGQGSGMVGLPGDWTPPSRFVRISTMLRFATQPANAGDGVNLAEHLLNSVDIPLGEIRSPDQTKGDYTQWVVIKDLSNKIFYFRSYKDLCLKMIDLKKLNFNVAAIGKSIPIESGKGYVDMTRVFSGKDLMTALNDATRCTPR